MRIMTAQERSADMKAFGKEIRKSKASAIEFLAECGDPRCQMRIGRTLPVLMAANWSAYEFQPSFILGFHGCEKAMGEAVLRGDEPHLKWSEKDYDWLGHGTYFCEGDPSRAAAWAELRKAEGKIAAPFVLGAIIDLRRCLDLFNHDSLSQVKDAYAELKRTLKLVGQPLPKNLGPTPDKAGRRLDCSVINYGSLGFPVGF